MPPTWIENAIDMSAKSQFCGGAGLEDRSSDQFVLLAKSCQFLGRILGRTGQQISFPVLPLPARQAR